jgi:hypothetical protein
LNRRECLEVIVAGAALSALPAWGGEVAPGLLVHDSRFGESRAFAAGASRVLDCCDDAAQLWHFQIGNAAMKPAVIRGLTLAADALVFTDCARQAGLRFIRGTPIDGSALVPWTIQSRLQA